MMIGRNNHSYATAAGVLQAVDEFIATHDLRLEVFEKNQFQINL